MIPTDRGIPPALGVASLERSRRLEERLRLLLAQRPAASTDLGRLTGALPAEVGAALQRLSDQGLAERGDRGRWSATG